MVGTDRVWPYEALCKQMHVVVPQELSCTEYRSELAPQRPRLAMPFIVDPEG